METPIQRLAVSAYTVPTDWPESDGTYAWDSTTLVLVEVTAGNVQGLGYTYADTVTAQLIKDALAEVVLGRDAMAVPGTWSAMVGAVRNLGRPGIASMAIAAVDVLEIFMNLDGHVDHAALGWRVGMLLAFAATMLVLAIADRVSASAKG